MIVKPSTTGLDRWESTSEAPLQIVAALFLVAYAAPIIHPSLPGWFTNTCSWVVIGAWVLFGIDYVARLILAEHRWRWFYTNLPSLFILIVPILRPLRLLRLVTLLNVLNRTSAHSLRGKVAVYATGGVTLLIICGALAITDAERGQPGSLIENFGDGLWWAVTTITTVGYGDTHPVSITGRIIAACLMAGGIALVGVVTATFASWLVEQVNETGTATTDATSERLAQIEEQMSALTNAIQQLNERRADAPSNAGSTTY